MQLAVTDVNFMCGDKWYVQKDGVAMRAAMAVILVNNWMRRFEDDIASDEPQSTNTEQKDLRLMIRQCVPSAPRRLLGKDTLYGARNASSS